MAVSTSAFAKHYHLLDGPERFVAVIEAMARRDAAEEERLDAACPRRAYEIDDPAYRRRMNISHTAAQLACASVTRDLDVLRAMAAFAEAAGEFSRWAGAAAECGFVAGWRAGQEAAGVERIVSVKEVIGGCAGAGASSGDEPEDGGGPDPDAGDHSGTPEGEGQAADAPGGDAGGDGGPDDRLTPEARAALADIRQEAGRPLEQAAEAITSAAGRGRAVALLSVWEGFGRFCLECLGVEPLTLARAWRLLDDDPAAEVRDLYPEARVREEQADEWHRNLAEAWRKHTDPY